ncbi:MAG TPA: isoprenylcysteine carboxylmethyltransferase family protein [Candidatus Dormibacteraeota bacterium]|nr:isoprenylcysteine carboxylmethyltransferase family protein [Candidatus Dormibacteraeota bacterium]
MIVALVTVVPWAAAEAWLQIRQFRQGGPVRRTELVSFGMILLALAAGTVAAFAAKDYFPQAAIPGSPVITFELGFLIAWTGIIFRLVSIHTLGRFFRMVVQVQEGHEVVRSGPYRILRHPSYAGLLLAMVGLGLTHHNFVSLAALVGCCLIGVLYRIRVEERVLRSELGATYVEYADHTSRLIPGVW